MTAIVLTYLSYVLISLALTIWVARTLFRNGALFLVDVFDGDETMARAVNHLLVVGFLLVNLGFVAFALQVSGDVPDARAAIEALSRKVGTVTLVVGAMHFGNLVVLHRMRRRARRHTPPAVAAGPRPGTTVPWVSPTPGA